jgi:transcriptional regulator with XRE-family HTH domain
MQALDVEIKVNNLVSDLSLGEKIRYYRKRMHMSQLILECSCNLCMGSVSRLESNQINPTKETLVKIVRVLKLNNEEILDLFGI